MEDTGDREGSPRTAENVETLEIGGDLILRRAHPSDAPELFDVVDSNRSFLKVWLPWLDANTTVDDSRSFIELINGQEDRGESLIRLITDAGAIVGTVGYRSLDPANRSGELGYWLAESAQGRGVVTRACAELIDFGFERLDLHRVVLAAGAENLRSRRVAERLGFREEGTMRDAEWLYDHFHDVVYYSLLSSDSSGERKERLPL